MKTNVVSIWDKMTESVQNNIAYPITYKDAARYESFVNFFPLKSDSFDDHIERIKDYDIVEVPQGFCFMYRDNFIMRYNTDINKIDKIVCVSQIEAWCAANGILSVSGHSHLAIVKLDDFAVLQSYFTR